MEEKKKQKRLFIIIGCIAAIIFLLVCVFLIFGNNKGVSTSVPEETKLAEVEKEQTEDDTTQPFAYEGNGGIWGIDQEQDGLREYYTNTADAKTVTMMVYMIASDIESENGLATADLEEMLDSGNGSALNIVVQTGGTKQWQNEKMSADKRQRWLLQNEEITLCEELPQDSMCKPENLADFITWSAENFPADRYILLLWDHGGGTMGGFGYDENFPDDHLSISQMASAVEQSGIKLDVMAFDACLMGTLEVGYAFEPSADYLLASEETVPGDGWSYTDALAALSENPAMPTVEFGARVIDSYADFYSQELNKKNVTLSLMDLREVPSIYEAFTDYFAHAEEKLLSGQDGFMKLSIARSNARNYDNGECDQIDLVDFVQYSDLDGSDELVRAVRSAVKYRNDSTLTGSNGTAIYFPYIDLNKYDHVKTDLENISYTGAETFYNKFLSVLASATAGNGDENEITEWKNEDADYATEPWFDSSMSQGYNFQTFSDPDKLTAKYSEKYDTYLLDLTDEEWASIPDVQFQVFLDDGEGYIDLGSDQHFDWTEEGDLILDFDNRWISMDNHLAAYKAFKPVEEGDDTKFIGKVSAVLNGDQEIDIYIDTTGNLAGETTTSVLGYLPVEDMGGTQPKGYFQLQSGNEIQLVADYYTYDGQYDAQYELGDPFTVTDPENIEISEIELQASNVLCWFQLTDLFRQNWYTQSREVSH